MHVFHGAAAHSEFRRERLFNELKSAHPALAALDSRHLYLAWFDGEPAPMALARVRDLVGPEMPTKLPLQCASVLVTPRVGTISPWSSKATDIARNSGLDRLVRLERATLWYFDGASVDALGDLIPHIHDRMTETVLDDVDAAASLHQDTTPRSLQSIPRDRAALANANRMLGLALADDEIEYLSARYDELGRDPTDIELMMFAQANSEHCRHKIFNADWRIDGEEQHASLFAMIRHTHECAPNQVLSAYKDNSAVTTGYAGRRFFPDPETARYASVDEDVHVLMKVETHNHPTAISPHPGAATGSGGEIRDEGATGRSAKPKAGLTGFSVSHLRIPGHPAPWEQARALNERLASAFEIMRDGPIGGAAFNNEFGRPALCGYFRCFEDHTVTADIRGYDKPIMLAGGLGNIRLHHVEKHIIDPGTKIVVLGGPAMLIGLGGGAASSMRAGSSDSDLDFASVQRDNPEMQRRCQEVINACWALGERNPALSIHDVGAGGLSNAVPEILHDSGRGGVIELRAIPNADPSMSPLEIWCNEAQERYVLAIAADRIGEFMAICARERCPAAVIGEATAGMQLQVLDSEQDNAPIDLPMDVIFGKPPKMFRDVNGADRPTNAYTTVGIDIPAALARVLAFPSVADKRFLITIGDRNVGGLSARDQMVGPWQTPVADCAVTASGFGDYTGEAMAIGERTPVALLDAPASGRLAVGEAITNIAAARIMKLGDIVLSANWMAAAGHPGEDAKLYETVRAVGLELCPALGIVIPVGKDSMSMKTQWRTDETDFAVTSPLSLIVSAFAPVVDIRESLTPQLRLECGASTLLFIDLAAGRQRLGGSILAQTDCALGDVPPDLDDPACLREFFTAIQLLNETGYVLAYHDRSDGGLITTLCEMAFAARCGIEIDVTALGGDAAAALFCEELGVVIQVRDADLDAVMAHFAAAPTLAGNVHALGSAVAERQIVVRHDGTTVIDEAVSQLLGSWSRTSWQMQSARDNPQCADEEYATIIDPDDPGLSLHAPITPTRFASAVNTSRPQIAILREQGVNGHVEMAAAFDRAGFDAIDVHMSELLAGRRSLAAFNGLVACGGFSYGDVLGAGGGWAKSILYNDSVREDFAAFFQRESTFTLGVCNGCQMLAHLAPLIPGAASWPRFRRNVSEQFEARLVMVEVAASASILFRDMAGMRAPIVVAHGEGRVAEAVDERVCLRYVDNRGAVAATYPGNPNGSAAGVTGLTSTDGRATIMMPHPERVFLATQFSWIDPDWPHAEGPWMQIFHNARHWLG